MSPAYYPALLNLNKKKCVVVGGGKVAARKVESLLKCGADVLVVSLDLTAKLSALKALGLIRHRGREYRRGDLKRAFLVIAATSNERINREVSRDANGLVNVVDAPELANFILPAVVRRGPLTIAISTSGTSPAVAAAVRIELERLYSRDFASYLLFLGKLRKEVSKTVPDGKKRERFFKAAASREVLAILRSKGVQRAKKDVLQKLMKLTTGDRKNRGARGTTRLLKSEDRHDR